LERHQVQLIAPLHCTGVGPSAQMIGAFPGRWLELQTGLRHDFA